MLMCERGCSRQARFDASHTNGAKCCIAAPTAIFADTYLSLAPSERHAYESVKSSHGCFAYFDLDATSSVVCLGLRDPCKSQQGGEPLSW